MLLLTYALVDRDAMGSFSTALVMRCVPAQVNGHRVVRLVRGIAQRRNSRHTQRGLLGTRSLLHRPVSHWVCGALCPRPSSSLVG